MLLDTGANVTLLRKDLAQKLKEQLICTGPNISLKIATGEKTEIRRKLDASIECGSRKFHHRIYVADITDPCILGLDFLQKFNFTVDLEKNEIRTGGEEIPLFSASVQHSKSCSVLAKKRTIIPARSECLIQGVPEVPGQFRYAVTNFPSQDSQKGVLVAATLVDLESEAIPVRVLNLNNKPKILDIGAVIATCEPVVDIVARAQEFSGAQHLPSTLKNFQILNEEQRTAVRKLLNEIQNLFSTCNAAVGRCNMTQHRINTGDHLPIKQYPRRLPLARKDEAEHLVKEMVDNGIIEESSGPWASHIVLVKKKEGSTRFCVDYRKLNEITKKDSYPLPRIDDTLDALNGSQWFTKLDLKSGYWQVEVRPEDREKTAFTTGQGLWQFKIMPFVLCNAPATFERLMETVLRGLSSEACLMYLDDIIIVGRTFEEHLNNLREVFQRLQKANLKLSPKKCRFFQKEVTYLGHIISAGVKIDPEHFHHYFYGQKFLLRTDHASLRWLLNFKEPEDQEASTVAEELVRSWISCYGVPMILHSNQGTNFNSALFTELCKLLGILKTRMTALHPESNGMVERFNRTILNHLSLFVSRNQTDWDTHLPLFLLAYRSAELEVTGLTPAEMFFGRTLRLPCDILFGRPSETPYSPNKYMKNLEARLESVHAFARERIKLASERMKTHYDSRATHHHFKEGDLVWMYNPKRRRGPSPKLQQNWEGPYTVVKKMTDVVYRVQRSPNAKPKVIHINRLAPYKATDHSSK
ncbi:Retrovirus-related Pol polyprotein from transposon 297 [Araneus ventricosus]|uniref:Retrovirus-related Pol polyprotein from transposon 297 n=1 Tax=Araneus ventricosus TaxID=182803 RepID=A0A4Y2C9E2_ARAVE|nr:Retrovirus-related Pol polyprotein from transposon 297 [Araneus ventricosus]